jgi:hypothetical protein
MGLLQRAPRSALTPLGALVLLLSLAWAAWNWCCSSAAGDAAGALIRASFGGCADFRMRITPPPCAMRLASP